MDVFLLWLFNYLSQNLQEFQQARNHLFEVLILKPEDYGKVITDVKASRKNNCWEYKSDLVLDFNLNGEAKVVFLENRISTLSMVKGYELNYPNFYVCVYLKSGTLLPQEYVYARKHDYVVRDVEIVLEALRPLSYNNTIIEHYRRYLIDAYLSEEMDTKDTVRDFYSELFRLRKKYS